MSKKFLFGALAAALLAVVVAADASAQTAPATVRATSLANRQVILTINGTTVSARFDPEVGGIKGMIVTNRGTGLVQTYESQTTATLAAGRYDITVFVTSSFGIRAMRDSATFTNVQVGDSGS